MWGKSLGTGLQTLHLESTACHIGWQMKGSADSPRMQGQITTHAPKERTPGAFSESEGKKSST